VTGTERYVVLGLAHVRSAWFRSVALWSNSGAVAVEFVKCLSAEEVTTRLRSGRPFSALMADAGLPSLDRDLIAAATAAGCAVLVVDDGRVRRDWADLGAARVLPATFDRDDLVHALAAHARRVARGEAASGDLLRRPAGSGWRGHLVAVTGPGGTGASTAAMALAQALGDDVRHGGMVLLADLRLHAELAMLHDAGDVAPGIQELVEAHRGGQPAAEEIRSMVFSVPERRYDLLLGLRRARHWPALRPKAFAAAIDSLERSFRVVVCDVDPDVEGEDEGGSLDVEERNVMARTAASRASCVLAVGLPTMKGLHALVRVLDGLLVFGVAAERIVPVLNRAPRSPRSRAALTATLAELSAPLVTGGDGDRLATPVFLPERRVDDALREGDRLPAGLGTPLAGAVAAIGARARPVERAEMPEPVRPGSLGRWATEGIGG
jgi:hypothetical protein